MKISTLIMASILLISCGSETTETVNEDPAIQDDTTNYSSEIEELYDDKEEVDIDYSEYESLAFGYANSTGDSILLMERNEANPANDYAFTITSTGVLSPISYLTTQKSGPNDTHRSNYYNFKNAEGDIYSPKNGIIDQWNTSIFMTKEYVQNRHILVADKSVKADDNSALIKRIEVDKNRKIKQVHPLAKYEEKGELYFVEFEKEKDSLLVSLIWITNRDLTYLDFPAIDDEISSWRVDDGGIFDFDMYQVIAVFESDNGIEIMTDWAGFEGSSANYYLLIDKKFEKVASAYRYQAPL